MCTLTILRDDERTLVTMNRDEARARGEELPPQHYKDEVEPGNQWIAPVDSVGGGTWIAVNDRGVAACLLNRYAPGDEDPARLLPGQYSRGEIIAALMRQPDERSALHHVRESLEPTRYGSFTLVVVGPTASHVFDWAHGDGLAESVLSQPREMLSSSAFETGEVLRWRRERYDAWLARGGVFRGHLPAIHLDRPAGMEEWAVLMDRAVSSTRSITQVETTRGGAECVMRYWPRHGDGQVSTTPERELALRRSV